MPFDSPYRPLAAFTASAALLLPLPAIAQTGITVALCNGGSVSIPVEQEGDGKKKDCRVACHAADSRKRLIRGLR